MICNEKVGCSVCLLTGSCWCNDWYQYQREAGRTEWILWLRCTLCECRVRHRRKLLTGLSLSLCFILLKKKLFSKSEYRNSSVTFSRYLVWDSCLCIWHYFTVLLSSILDAVCYVVLIYQSVQLISQQILAAVYDDIRKVYINT